MPPKTTFQRDDVIQAAFEIIQEQGLKKLSARKVAERLGSSTAPVYSCFDSMDKLAREAIRKAKDLLFQYATRPHTENAFLNIGVGVVLFSRDYNLLYQALFSESSKFKEVVEELGKSFGEQMTKVPRLEGISCVDRRNLLRKMWIFTHGLATLINIGLIEDNSDEYIINILQSVGKAVTDAAVAEIQK